VANRRTVAEALTDSRWALDLHGQFSESVLQELLLLSDLVAGISTQLGQPDKHFWRMSASGQYSTKSAYEASFTGSLLFGAYERIWKTWALPKCALFLWLVIHNRCWTADRLAKRNLPHPNLCLLCEQEQEFINHLLVGCVFARQFWFILLQRVELAALAPLPAVASFDEWWRQASDSVSGIVRKGLNPLIMLGAWTIWWHRNKCLQWKISPPSDSIAYGGGGHLLLDFDWCRKVSSTLWLQAGGRVAGQGVLSGRCL
jgi:hypothetical protein